MPDTLMMGVDAKGLSGLCERICTSLFWSAVIKGQIKPQQLKSLPMQKMLSPLWQERRCVSDL
jgi:hypothetical protein